MNFIPLRLEGAFLIIPDVHVDVRGEYQRTFTREEFEAHGLIGEFVEAGVAFNRRAGTVRGLHYQCEPYMQAKLVRCLQGAILDVIVDLRGTSSTYLQHQPIWLPSDKPRMLYVPEGFAHGYQTQMDDTVVEYHMTNPHRSEFASGVRFDDPMLNIRMLLPVTSILDRDATYPELLNRVKEY
jgi:dTDP-4-dehydrorhamnose 3,5-epimerase